MKNKKEIILIIIIIAVLGFAVFFIYKDFKKSKNKNNEILKTLSKNDDKIKILENNEEQNKNSNTSAIDLSKIKIPDLSGAQAVNSNLPENIKDKTLEEINALKNSLKKDYGSLEEWMQLGLLKKLLGDYNGARDAWEFAAAIRPKDSISRHNLGNLYWQNFKDFKKAEENYLISLELNPKDISAYVDLSNIYYYDLKDKTKAKNILNRGLKNNPNNEELKRALKDMGL